eukprot:10577_1
MANDGNKIPLEILTFLRIKNSKSTSEEENNCNSLEPHYPSNENKMQNSVANYPAAQFYQQQQRNKVQNSVVIELIPYNCSITALEMENRRENGDQTFKEINDKSIHNKQLLLNCANWNIIIDTIYQNTMYIERKDKLNLLKKLKEIASNSLLGDVYRIIKLDNNNNKKMLSRNKGVIEILKGLGFKNGIIDNSLVIINPDETIIETAVTAIKNKIKLIKMYYSATLLWKKCLSYMMKHQCYAYQNILLTLITFDFENNYNEYYDILNKLLQIDSQNIKHHDLIVKMMINIGIKLPPDVLIIEDDIHRQIVDLMGQIYEQFKQIEIFKQTIHITNYYEICNDIKLSKKASICNQYVLKLEEVENIKMTGYEHFENIIEIKSD